MAETITIFLNMVFLRRIYAITRAMEPAEAVAESDILQLYTGSVSELSYN